MLPPSLQPKAGAARLGVQVPANGTTLQSGCPESKAGSLVRRDQLKTLLYKNFQTLRTAVGKLALSVRPPEDAPIVPVTEQPALPSADRGGRHKKAGIALRSEILHVLVSERPLLQLESHCRSAWKTLPAIPSTHKLCYVPGQDRFG